METRTAFILAAADCLFLAVPTIFPSTPYWLAVGLFALGLVFIAAAFFWRGKSSQPESSASFKLLDVTDSSNITIGNVRARGYKNVEVGEARRTNGLNIGNIDLDTK